MPIYQFTAPDGKKYRVQGDGSKEEAFQQLQEQLAQQGGAPEPGAPTPGAPGTPPAAPASLGGPRAAAPGGGGDPQIPGPPGGAGAVEPSTASTMMNALALPDVPKKRQFGTLFQHNIQPGTVDIANDVVDPRTGDTRLDLLKAAPGSQLVDWWRGAKQRYAEATGDTEELQRLEQEEAEVRDREALLRNSGAGRLGRVGTQVAAGGAAALLGAPAIGATATGLQALGLGSGASALGSAMLFGGAEGAAQGAIMPTTAEEDWRQNAKFGGAVGFGAPAALAAAPKALVAAGKLPWWLTKQATPHGIVKVAEAATRPLRRKGAEKAAAAAAAKESEAAAFTAASKEAGRKEVSGAMKEVFLPHEKLGRELRELLDEAGSDIPPSLANKVRKALGDTDADKLFKALQAQKGPASRPKKIKKPAAALPALPAPPAHPPGFTPPGPRRKPSAPQKPIREDQMPYGGATSGVHRAEYRPAGIDDSRRYMVRLTPESNKEFQADFPAANKSVYVEDVAKTRTKAAEGEEVEQMALRAKGQSKEYRPKKPPKGELQKPANITGAVRGGENEPYKSVGAKLTEGIKPKDMDAFIEEQTKVSRAAWEKTHRGKSYDEPYIVGGKRASKELRHASQADFDREFFRREYKHGDPEGAANSLSGASHKDFRAEYARRQTHSKMRADTNAEAAEAIAKSGRDTPNARAKALRKEGNKFMRDVFAPDTRGAVKHEDPLVARSRIRKEMAKANAVPETKYGDNKRLTKAEKAALKSKGLQQLNKTQPPKPLDRPYEPGGDLDAFVKHNRETLRHERGRPNVPYSRGSMRADVTSADPLFKQQGLRKYAKSTVTNEEGRFMKDPKTGKYTQRIDIQEHQRGLGKYYENREKTGYNRDMEDYYEEDAGLGRPSKLPGVPAREQKRKHIKELIESSRRVSETNPRLPKDRPPGYRPPAGGGRGGPPKPPKPPKGPYEGPNVGPTIKGSALDEIMQLAEKNTSKGIKGESIKRLVGIIENASNRAAGEGTRKRLSAARAKALHGERPKISNKGYWSWGGSLTRALVDEFRGRRMSDKELEERRKKRREK